MAAPGPFEMGSHGDPARGSHPPVGELRAAISPRLRSGPPALALVLEPHLYIAAAVVLAPVAGLGRARTLGFALIAMLVAGGLVFGSEWISLPGAGAGRHDLSVMNWNVQYGTRTPADQAAQLKASPPTSSLSRRSSQMLRPPSRPTRSSRLTIRTGPWRRESGPGTGPAEPLPDLRVDSTNHPACLDLLVATPRGRSGHRRPSGARGHRHGDAAPGADRLRSPPTATARSRRPGPDRGRARRRRQTARSRRLQHHSLGGRVRDVVGRTPRHPRPGRQGPGWTWRPSRRRSCRRSPPDRPAAERRVDLAQSPRRSIARCPAITAGCSGDYEIGG